MNRWRELLSWRLLLQLILYILFVAIYLGAALHLRGWIKHIYDSNKLLYALFSLGFICAQGIFFEFLTGLIPLALGKKIKR